MFVVPSSSHDSGTTAASGTGSGIIGIFTQALVAHGPLKMGVNFLRSSGRAPLRA